MLRPVDLAQGAPDEPDALRRAERLLEAAAHSGALSGLSESARLIDLLGELGLMPPTRTIAQIAADLTTRLATIDVHDPEAPWSAIAEIKNRHVLRVGLADFAGALDPIAVCAELTTIAEACLAHALTIVEAQLVATYGPPPGDARLAVLGLGKLGGRELGYAADLDVVFVFSSQDDEAIAWFSRCAQRLLGALRQRTPRGRLYELDTRLRPSGTAGLLVTSLSGWRRYHAEHARLWERQALVKLRPVAGDRELGEEVARLAAETVYGTQVGDPRAVAREIRAMRDRIERELGAASDLKTGAGGIMDVEFAAQYLQLVHGPAHPALRTTSTQEALRAAVTCGIAPTREIELLDQGYTFLRKIEHRMRVVHDRAIHRLPDTRDELDKLARRSGFLDGGVLLDHVERWQHDIRAAYLQLVGA